MIKTIGSNLTSALAEPKVPDIQQMKTTISILSLVSLLALAACAGAGANGSKGLSVDSATAGAKTTNCITNHVIEIAHHRYIDPDPNDTKRKKALRIHWTFTDDKNKGALHGKLINPGEVIEWRCPELQFTLVVTNKIDWTSGCGFPLNWRPDVPFPYNDSNFGAVDSVQEGTNWVVRLKFSTNSIPELEMHYLVVIPTIPSTNAALRGGKRILAVPYDYSMVDATLVWPGELGR